MRILGPLGRGMVPVLTTGTWAVIFLRDPWGWSLLVVPLLMAAVAVTLARPLLGAVVLGAASLTALLTNCPYGSLELICGISVVLGWLGRYESRPAPGLVGLPLVVVPTAFRDGFEPGKLVVCTLIFGSAWLFGRLARRRALAADRAVAEAERLAAADPLALAQPAAAAERLAAADHAAIKLRAAVKDMLSTIDDVVADGSPDLAGVYRIRERGSRAVEELRRQRGGSDVEGCQVTLR